MQELTSARRPGVRLLCSRPRPATRRGCSRDAAARLGVELVYATDRCDQLDDPWSDGAIAVRYHEEWRSVDAVLKARRSPAGQRRAGGRRSADGAGGLPGAAARPAGPSARSGRGRARQAPDARAAEGRADCRRPRSSPCRSRPIRWRCSIASRSRSSSSRRCCPAAAASFALTMPMSFATAFDRVRRLLAVARGARAARSGSRRRADRGLHRGRRVRARGHPRERRAADAGPLRQARSARRSVLRGDDLRHAVARPAVAQRQIEMPSPAPRAALGLHHGPIHAECRVNASGVFVLEVAARPIGGLCAKALRFEATPASGDRSASKNCCCATRWASRSPAGSVRRASAVMMIPIPRSGVYRARRGSGGGDGVPRVEEMRITAKPDQQLLPLPEGASYLGFIFARADTPALAERAVRDAHAQLAIHDRSADTK